MSSDGGADVLDPLRGHARLVDWMPGRRVLEAMALQRDPSTGTSWGAPGKPPMFIYEAWGEGDRDDERHGTTLKASGCRMLAERRQLQEFLASENVQLVIDVEIRREGRDSRRSYDAQDQTPEAAYDRIYRLDGEGGLHIAEGRVGAWTGDRTAA